MPEADVTVIGRLNAAIQMTKATQSMAPLVVLDISEAEEILERLFDGCGDHETCEECEARFCTTCEDGEPGGCSHARSLCASCVLQCSVCRAEMEPEFVHPGERYL